MKEPIISIVIATYNSEKTLSLVLESIEKQDYPKSKVDVLIIDGGSIDQTIKIAKKFRCRICDNPKREPLFAKHLGFLKAKGDYLVYLDSDEVMENPLSLKLKYLIFKKYTQVVAVIPSGYRVPTGCPSINHYINELGDPFSFFIYRLSKGADFFTKELLNNYKIVCEDKNCTVFNFYKVSPLPFLELGAMGTMIDLKYLKKNYSEINKNLSIAPFLFYIINGEFNNITIAKNDNIFHYSSDTFNKYLKKIKSRVKNNVYSTPMGEGGFSGRDRFQPLWFRLKKYLFIPYSFSVIFPCIDSITFSITRRNIIYFIHPFLCIYTAALISYYYFLRLMGVKQIIKSYGN